MPKREDVLEALAWLARWFGGRRERLRERIRQYEARVAERLIAETDAAINGKARVQMCGFTLRVEFGEKGVSILAVEPPVGHVRSLLLKSRL